jgi:hypothetical protein
VDTVIHPAHLARSSAAVWHYFRMNATRAGARRVTALIALGCAAPLLLAACSSEPTAAEPTAAEPSREAGNLGTRVCVLNNTSLEATIAFSRKDTAQEGVIPAGGRACGEGTFGTGRDVIGKVTWGNPSWITEFSASNPWMGPPDARVSENLPTGKTICLGQGFNVNESLSGDNGIVQTKLTRLADGQWKEFELIFSPSAQASPNGERSLVSGFRNCNAPVAPAS